MTDEEVHILTVKYLVGEIEAGEEETLLVWLSQNEDNRRVFRSLKDAFDLGQIDNHIKNSNVAEEWKKLLSRIKPVAKPIRIISTYKKILQYAAVFILSFICLKVMDNISVKPPSEKYVTRIETGKGERSKVTLPDSTIVWLNACSSISYDHDFDIRTRKIDMKGEAYFDVRRNKSKPFSVCIDSLIFRVTGTSFNIYSFDDDNTVSLALVEGSVIFEYGSYSTGVKPGELIEFDRTTGKISRHRADMDFYTRWRFGDLVFEKMTFEELAKRLERNFNVVFVFENDQVKKESFGGTFRNYDSLETILKVISTSTPIRYEIDRNVVYIK
jgi:ferric-dicitrate binding protein FerR (iron transport regulator)